jgi:ethanolamine utilization protein EutQ (cupin superfamily)
MQVLGLSADRAGSGFQVGDGEIYVSDVVDQATEPEAEMTVGFARVGEGEELDISFPYDEVLIVTKGSYTVRTEQGDEVTARPGDVIYLPAGSASSSRADADAEMVYVASPAGTYADHVAASTT